MADNTLAALVKDVDNPDWFLEVLGQALEETGDMDSAIRVAQRYVADQPHPPISQEDKDTRAVLDALNQEQPQEQPQGKYSLERCRDLVRGM